MTDTPSPRKRAPHLTLAAPTATEGSGDEARTAVDKAFELLAAFPGGGATAGVTELARDLGLSKSTVFRLLTIMERNGLVERHDGRYRLGRRLYDLGAQVYEPQPGSLHELLSPCMAYLYEKSHETVHLGILLDGEVALLGRIHRQSATSNTARIGARFPAHCTALGKAMLAYHPDAADALIARGLPARTQHTIVDEAVLRAELRRIRTQGIATSRQEARPNLTCVAVPLLDQAGRPIAALSISGSSAAFDIQRHAALLRSVASDAQRMARGATRRSQHPQRSTEDAASKTSLRPVPTSNLTRYLAAV